MMIVAASTSTDCTPRQKRSTMRDAVRELMQAKDATAEGMTSGTGIPGMVDASVLLPRTR